MPTTDGWETVASKSKSRKQGSEDTFMSIDREYLSEYINSKCDEQCSETDFDNVVRSMLTTSPISLFQAIQIVHKFNSCVDQHVHHRRNYLIGIVKKTNAVWECEPENAELLEARPTHNPETVQLLFDLCKSDELSPDVFSPSVALALLSLTPEQLESTVARYNQAPLEYTDTFHRKQQYLLQVAHAVSSNDSTHDPHNQNSGRKQTWAEQIGGANPEDNSNMTNNNAQFGAATEHGSLIRDGESTKSQSSNSSRSILSNIGNSTNQPQQQQQQINLEQYYTPESEQKAAQELPGMLVAFINSKCAQNDNVKKSDFDGTARDALRRMSFIQALQAIEHFAGSVSSRINKRPAYLMGILRGQDTHWDKSRAAAQCVGGSAELLNLSPNVLMTIAKLCLGSNCIPSDFTPEVCLALKGLPPVLAVKAIMAFDSNKRIVAGLKGGVGNRPRFFQRLIENVAEQYEKGVGHSNTTTSQQPQSGKVAAQQQPKGTTNLKSKPERTKNSEDTTEPAPEVPHDTHTTSTTTKRRPPALNTTSSTPGSTPTGTPSTSPVNGNHVAVAQHALGIGPAFPSYIEDDLRSNTSRRGSIGSTVSATSSNVDNNTIGFNNVGSSLARTSVWSDSNSQQTWTNDERRKGNLVNGATALTPSGTSSLAPWASHDSHTNTSLGPRPSTGPDTYVSSSSLFSDVAPHFGGDRYSADDIEDSNGTFENHSTGGDGPLLAPGSSATPSVTPSGQNRFWGSGEQTSLSMDSGLGWKEQEFLPELKASAKPFSPPSYNEPGQKSLGLSIGPIVEPRRHSLESSTIHARDETFVENGNDSRLVPDNVRIEELTKEIARMKHNEAMLVMELSSIRTQWHAALAELNYVRANAATQLQRTDVLFQTWGVGQHGGSQPNGPANKPNSDVDLPLH